MPARWRNSAAAVPPMPPPTIATRVVIASTLQAAQDAIRFRAPVAVCKCRVCAIAERAAIDEVRQPLHAIGGAAGRPWRQTDLVDGLRHLAHLLGAAPAVHHDSLEEV